jgi:hypothetical protein
MMIYKLESGKQAVVPPSYNDDFRLFMRSLGAQWKTIPIEGKSAKAWIFEPKHAEDVQAAYERAYGAAPAAPTALVATFPTPCPRSTVRPVIEVIEIQIDQSVLFVVGGEFDLMKNRIKALQGRKWDSDSKRWILNSSWTIESLTEELSGLGWTLVFEDALLDFEIAAIQQWQQNLIEIREQVEQQIEGLSDRIDSYSYRSKSQVKSNLVRDRALLLGALDAAQKSIEQLSEVEVRSLRAALREMGGGAHARSRCA